MGGNGQKEVYSDVSLLLKHFPVALSISGLHDDVIHCTTCRQNYCNKNYILLLWLIKTNNIGLQTAPPRLLRRFMTLATQSLTYKGSSWSRF